MDGKVLLVRDRGRRRYSLPGGGIHRGEPSISAAARELYEEVGLSADKIERVTTYQSRTRQHTVFLITQFHGRLRLKSEIDGMLWWDGKAEVPMFRHVSEIVRQVEGETWPANQEQRLAFSAVLLAASN